ncbi:MULTISPECIES: GAF domain-containing protein [unclassified Pseudodesulfovibrio]|uniref:GAF domain-containing protein n=1 Tax=unclassified Pseudodesulfovibrio TaxID=2661612 RepID=UPI0019D490F4|nr:MULTISPECIES: GAF domain-containing protein [unclassified Pseudodesulfovibrio]
MPAENANFDQVVSNLSYSLITSGYSTTGIANIVLNYAKNVTQSTLGYASVIDPMTKNNICHTLTGMIGDSCRIPPSKSGIVFPVGSTGEYPTLWGHALNTRTPFYTNALGEHPASKGLPSDHVKIERFLSVPVVLGDELCGQISLANSEDDYNDQDLENVSQVAVLFAHALKRFQLDDAKTPSHAPMKHRAASPEGEGGQAAAEQLEELPRIIQTTITSNLKRLTTPYIDQLKQTELNSAQLFLLEKLQENLEGCGSSLLSHSRLMNVTFTPQEFQIAILIKSGLKTKEIAEQLDISINAINFHRKNIRKKLSISNKDVNLQTYLLSLEEW